jgi:hypothetical protein
MPSASQSNTLNALLKVGCISHLKEGKAYLDIYLKNCNAQVRKVFYQLLHTIG